MAFTAAVSSSGTRAAVSGVRLETPPGTPGVNMLNAGEDAGAEKGLPSAGAAGVFDPRGDEVTFDEGARHEETFSSGTGASSFSGTTGASTRGTSSTSSSGTGASTRGTSSASPRQPSTAVVSIPSKSEVRVSANHSSVSVSAGWECSEATVAGVRAGGGGIVASASASACSSPRVPSSASSSPASPTARVLGPVEGGVRRIVLTAARTPPGVCEVFVTVAMGDRGAASREGDDAGSAGAGASSSASSSASAPSFAGVNLGLPARVLAEAVVAGLRASSLRA